MMLSESFDLRLLKDCVEEVSQRVAALDNALKLRREADIPDAGDGLYLLSRARLLTIEHQKYMEILYARALKVVL